MSNKPESSPGKKLSLNKRKMIAGELISRAAKIRAGYKPDQNRTGTTFCLNESNGQSTLEISRTVTDYAAKPRVTTTESATVHFPEGHFYFNQTWESEDKYTRAPYFPSNDAAAFARIGILIETFSNKKD